MPDLRKRFRAVDRVPAPDLWPRVLGDDARPLARPARTSRTPALVAMAAAVAVVVMAATVLTRNDKEPGVRVDPVAAPGSPSDQTVAPPAVAAVNGRIAFVRVDPRSAAREGGLAQATLFAVGPDGGAPVRLADASPRSAPAWSPDGSVLAFARGGIVVVGADGKNEKTVAACAPPACDGVGAPVWSPDAKRIAFPSSGAAGSGLFVVPSGGGQPKLLAKDVTVSGAMAWSPDGDEIAFVGRTGGDVDAVLAVDAVNGNVLRTIQPRGITFGEGVAFSPDGKRLAVPAMPEGETGMSIHVMTAEGRDLEKVTVSTSADMSPAWSPDGTSIAFTRATNERGSDGFTGDVFVVALDGSPGSEREARPLTSGPGLDCCPSWQAAAPR